jgi:hypothetical protein
VNFALTPTFFTTIPVDPNFEIPTLRSIDPLLNTPELAVQEFQFGPSDLLTAEMKAMGKLAYTPSEWGARNPKFDTQVHILCSSSS